MEINAATANAEASRIRARAREHKRRSGLERSLMRKEMRRLDEFRATCKRFGIELILEDERPINTEPKGQSDDSTKDSNAGA